MVLWRYAVAAPFWWDKIRVWFMPAGWRPRGLPQKEMIEITPENQIKYSPPLFEKARAYLILQIMVGIFLMMGVISNLLGWTTSMRWAGAFLLWWHIVNWSGILEARAWLWISENLRIIVTAAAVIVFNGLYRPSAFLFIVLGVSLFSFVWTNLFFRPSSPTVETAEI
jgi:hypothetical protein